jgi:hypothetical protein
MKSKFTPFNKNNVANKENITHHNIADKHGASVSTGFDRIQKAMD